MAFLLSTCVLVPGAIRGWAGEMDMAAVRRAATAASSTHLDASARIRVAETFRGLVAIPGGSGAEEAIRDELRRRLSAIGARELPLLQDGTNVPVNLAMEIPASSGAAGRPGILLNPHLDTLVLSTPDQMVFAVVSGASTLEPALELTGNSADQPQR